MVCGTKTFATPEVLKKEISSEDYNEKLKGVLLVHALKVFLMSNSTNKI